MLCAPFLRFHVGKRARCEEIGVGAVKVAEFDLQDLTIGILEPRVVGIGFEGDQFRLEVVARERRPRRFVVLLLAGERPVIDMTRMTELDSQFVLLLGVWSQAETEGLSDEHRQSLTSLIALAPARRQPVRLHAGLDLKPLKRCEALLSQG